MDVVDVGLLVGTLIALILIHWFLVGPWMDRRRNERSLTRQVVRQRVVVNLKPSPAGQTYFDGALWDQDADVVILKGATVFLPGANPQEVPGAAMIYRDDIDWIQIVDGV